MVFCPLCGSQLEFVERSSDHFLEIYRCPKGCAKDNWIVEKDDEQRILLRQAYEVEESLV